MKIVNVTPGLIPIPPNGWGAVEKIIWEYHNNLLKLGHDSHIKYLNEINPNEYDIVHIHVANLAIEAHKRGIPYYFTMHDHHTYLHGKDSQLFTENYKAIQNSILSFVPANYLVNYFDLNNIMYLSHGVNTKLFEPGDTNEQSILCVANNGYADDVTYDRKGFLPAIEVAEELNLPITICGPTKNNKLFFDKNKVDYDKLTVKYDLTEEELISEYKKHTIFLHLSELEAGHPNLTLLEAMASGLVVVGTLESDVNIKGFMKVSKDVKTAVAAVNVLINNYNDIQSNSLDSVKSYDWSYIVKQLVIQYKYHKETIRSKFTNAYNSDNLKKIQKEYRPTDNKIHISFIQGPRVEITGNTPADYSVKFIDRKTNEVKYETDIKTNHWAKASIEYYTEWDIVVEKLGDRTYTHNFNPEGKLIYIALESKAIGDTLAWLPMVDDFAKIHKCNVVTSTFHNDLFKKQYPHIKFINPGETVRGIYAMYSLGLFYNKENRYELTKHPSDFLKQPLQKMAADILGLKYIKEIKPKLAKFKIKPDDKLITIGIHGTTQAKYWNNPNGWQEVVDWLNKKGYTVKLISKEGDGYMGNNHPIGIIQRPNGSLLDAMKEIKRSKLFIGIGSGLSWLSWALGTKTVLISGFSYDWAEFEDCIRIAAPEGKCAGCFNRTRLDAGDWNWCPDHKNTDRQYECTKSITGQMVISRLKTIL
jgi:autotransporter strand-loop-strand O-heptosyltransferase